MLAARLFPEVRGGVVSRGPGRWQRLLLHELYHNPQTGGLLGDGPSIRVRRFATTDSEYAAARRAARILVSKGLARPFNGWAHTLYQVSPAPDVVCPECGRKCSEVVQNEPPRNTYGETLSVPNCATPQANSEHLQPGTALRWVAT